MLLREFYDVLNPNNWPLFALVLSRVTGLTLTAPYLSMQTIPARVRLGFTLLVSLMLFPLARNPFPVVNSSALPAWVFTELMIGAAIGLVAAIFFSAFAIAGELVGVQIGLSMASAFDPTTNITVPIIGQVINMFVLVIFMLVGGELILLRGLGDSLAVLPAGTATSVASGGHLLVRLMESSFHIALQVSAPILIAVLIANLILGTLAKAAPKMQVFTAAIPVTIMVGLILVGMMLPLLATFVTGWVNALPGQINDALQAFAGK